LIPASSASNVPAPDPGARSLQLAYTAARVIDENRGREIRILDLRSQTAVFDFFVLASGSSVRQMHSIADEIEKVVKQELGDKKIGIEGYTHGGWVLIDFGDVVVHLFDDAAREYYALEDLWGQAKRIPYPPTAELGIVRPE
jgi:ribosome-associated protein